MQIYLITNNITQQNYTGQTIWNFNERYHGSWHKWSHNKYLKNAAKKYGHENFTITILEKDVPNQEWLDNLEDYYINKYNCMYPNGYNFQRGGQTGYTKDYLAKEYELKDSNGNIYQIINLSEFCRLNNLSYGAMLNMVCGINTSSQGYALSSTPVELILNPNEQWELEEIATKIIYKVKRKDMAKFAMSKNINIDYLQGLVNKKAYVSHGFKLKETIIDGEKIRPEIQKYKNIKLINKEGKEIVINNIYKYCIEHKLSRSAFYKLIEGRALEAYGFRLPNKSLEEFTEEKELRLGKHIKLKNINTGEIFEIQNVSKFCRDNKIPLGTFGTMTGGYIKQYMGYCLAETDLTNYKYPKKIIYIKMKNTLGEIVEGKNPKEIEKHHNISSQMIYDFISQREQTCKGWVLLQVKYLNNYYPEINNQ